jgi:4-hydroxybenzoyl-CoA thioesterase/acyl-CoA thioester hydrolase
MSESNVQAFHWNRRIEFAETDAAGIAHFSTFIFVMEQAEHALFRSLGLSIFMPLASVPASLTLPPEWLQLPANTIWTWPRVHCECDFVAPARFEDELIVSVAIERMGSKSITYAHRIARGPQTIATGRMIAVCSLKNPETGQLVGQPIPQGLRDWLSPFVAASTDNPP